MNEQTNVELTLHYNVDSTLPQTLLTLTLIKRLRAIWDLFLFYLCRNVFNANSQSVFWAAANSVMQID